MLSIGRLTLTDLTKKAENLEKQFEKLQTDHDALAEKESPPKKQINTFQKKCADVKKQSKQIIQKAEKMKPDPKIEEFPEKKTEQINRFAEIIAKIDAFPFYESKGLSTPSTPGAERAEPPLEEEAPPEVAEAEAEERPNEYDQPPVEHEESEPEIQPPKAESPKPVEPPKQESGGSESEGEEEEEVKKEIPPERKETATVDSPQFDAIGDFSGPEPGDLSFKTGEVLTILATRPDGWWQAQNENGERGLVPSNKLRSRYEEIRTEPEAETSKKSEEKLSEEEEEKEEEPIIPKQAKRWGSMQKQFRQKSITEVIESMGGLPQGMVPSELAERHAKNSHLSLACHLVPRLSESNLGFHDLYWNIDANKLRKRRVRVLKCARLLKCENMPPTNDLAGLEVEQRFVRICLFDGKQVVSNVHSIIAQYNPAKPKTWTFLDKVTDKQSCAEYNEFFVRSNYADKDVVLLIEMCLAYKRTNETGELSCGWTTLNLLNESGVEAIEDKKHDLALKGGSPFEGKDLPLGATQDKAGSALRSKMSSENQPKLSIKVFGPPSANLEQLDCLPDVLVWNTLLVPFGFYYRQIAGQVLLRDRINTQSAELIPDLFLATFPYVAQEADIMDIVRIIWGEKLKTLKKDSKKSEELTAAEFRKVFVQTGAILLNSAVLPAYSLGNGTGLKERKASFDKFMDIWRKEQSPVTWLAGASEKYKPLNIFDMALTLIGPHSID